MPSLTRGIKQMSLKSTVNVCTKSVISYKEYTVWKEVEQRASAADKSTLGEEEDWDAEPSLPPWETPPGASSMAPSQEDEWKRMIDQDPHSGSIAGDSGHSTITATGKLNPSKMSKNSLEQLEGSTRVLLQNTSQVSNGEMMTHCLCSLMIMLRSPRP